MFDLQIATIARHKKKTLAVRNLKESSRVNALVFKGALRFTHSELKLPTSRFATVVRGSMSAL